MGRGHGHSLPGLDALSAGDKGSVLGARCDIRSVLGDNPSPSSSSSLAESPKSKLLSFPNQRSSHQPHCRRTVHRVEKHASFNTSGRRQIISSVVTSLYLVHQQHSQVNNPAVISWGLLRTPQRTGITMKLPAPVPPLSAIIQPPRWLPRPGPRHSQGRWGQTVQRNLVSSWPCPFWQEVALLLRGIC